MQEMASERTLREGWKLGSLEVPNRVMLAPLAGIGNWFVRLQAKRYGAGMAVSEMVSTYAIHYRNRKTCEEMLRIDPREREGGPVAIQLFGEDPEMMRSRPPMWPPWGPTRSTSTWDARCRRSPRPAPGPPCCATPSAPSRSPRPPSRGSPKPAPRRRYR